MVKLFFQKLIWVKKLHSTGVLKANLPLRGRPVPGMVKLNHWVRLCLITQNAYTFKRRIYIYRFFGGYTPLGRIFLHFLVAGRYRFENFTGNPSKFP